jgi:ribosomal-protein-alanine N-acetyltransferase
MQRHEPSIERLETDRLVLIRPTAADAQAVFDRYASDPAVTRYLAWPTHRTVDDTSLFIEFSDAEWERSPAGPYLIRAKADGRLLGATGLSFDATGAATTGYVLATDAWGRGYATEALRAMVDLARSLGLPSLTAYCHPDHAPSIRVLERCGFRWDAVVPAFAEFPNLTAGVKADVARYVREIAGPFGPS